MPLCLGARFLSILKGKGDFLSITVERKRYDEKKRNSLFLDSDDGGSW